MGDQKVQSTILLSYLTIISVVTGLAYADPIVQYTKSKIVDGLDVSNNDLVNAGKRTLESVNAYDYWDNVTGRSTARALLLINNGLSRAGAGTGYEAMGDGDGFTLEFVLNTSVNTAGYSIRRIDLTNSGNGDYLSNHNETVSYSTVDAPDTFISYCTTSQNNRGTGYQSCCASISDTTGFIATGVKKIRIAYGANPWPGGSGGWDTRIFASEVDVFGYATGSEPPMTVTLEVGSGTTINAFPVNSMDLVNAGAPTLSALNAIGFTDGSAGWGDWGYAPINDGLSSATSAGVFAADGTNWTAEFVLDTSVNTLGYNLSGINLMTSWSGGRVGHYDTVSYSTVSAPDTFLPLGNYLLYNGAYGGNPNPHSTRVRLEGDGGFIATHVKKIRIKYEPPVAGFNVVQQEVDVFGVPVGTAFGPSPADGAFAGPYAGLSWWQTVTPGAGNGYHVYLGTSADAVSAATTSSPEYKGFIANSAYDPGTLSEDSSYYWRIDSVQNGQTVTGPVWSFVVNCANKLDYAGRVVGYYPDWGTGQLPPAQVRYDQLDSIIYFSISPQPNGELDLGRINIPTMQTLVSSAHAQNTSVSICVGGWGLSDNFSAMAANATARAAFVANLAQFCTDYNLDGVDFDWEPVSNDTDRINYTLLIQEMKAALAPSERELTVAVGSFGAELDPSAIPAIDWLHVMAYDMGEPHSPYGRAIESLAHWRNFGFSKDKLMLGVPFYGRAPGTAYTYKDIIDTYAPGPEVDLVNGINFNGIDTIKAKTDYAFSNGYGGIMIWEISQDSSDATSLLTAIGQAAAGSLANCGYSMIPPDTLTATASSGSVSTPSYADPMMVVNGFGLTSPTAHTYNGGTWFTDGAETNRWIVIDLAQTYQLDHIRIWNANEGWFWNAYGFRDTHIYVSNEETPGNPVSNPDNWTLAMSVTLPMAPGTAGYDESQVVDLAGHTASHVALRAMNTHYANPTAGLSEVQIFRVRLASDLDGNGLVNLADLKILVENWLSESDIADKISGSSKVDLFDFSVFASQWLNGTVD